MIIKTATFIRGITDLQYAPKSDCPEYAFIGRSNVGKSSLINLLTGIKKLAKVSQTPGKTREINFFSINDEWRLSDLPGYGFAKVSKTQRETMEHMVTDYVANRKELVCLFLLVDSRIPPQKSDLSVMRWLGVHQVPFAIVFTKIDKLSSSELAKNMARYKKEILNEWESLPEVFQSSAETGHGKEQILDFIYRLNKAFFQKKGGKAENPAL